MTQVTAEQAEAGQAVYTKQTLAVYDFVVLGISNRFLWKCPTLSIEVDPHDIAALEIPGSSAEIGRIRELVIGVTRNGVCIVECRPIPCPRHCLRIPLRAMVGMIALSGQGSPPKMNGLNFRFFKLTPKWVRMFHLGKDDGEEQFTQII